MYRLTLAAIAALAVGLIGDWMFVVLTPSAVSEPMPIASNNVLAPASASIASPVTQRESPPRAAESNPTTFATEAQASENAARATVVPVDPKSRFSTAPPPAASNKSPPLILGIRH